MKLYVDDLRKCPEGWHVARTVKEAIRILATVPVEVVSLDHDISFQGRHGIDLETFEGVAWFIAFMKWPPKVYIHTANVLAGQHMAAILSDFAVDVTITPGSYDLSEETNYDA
jgi:hypothetical protein